MYVIFDVTHRLYRGVISDLTRIYKARNIRNTLGIVFNLRETEALVKVKDRNDIPQELRDRIVQVTLRSVSGQGFFLREQRADISEWWPVDMDRFETLRAEGTYKGERVELIFREREEYRDDAEDVRRDKLGLPSLPRGFQDDGTAPSPSR